MVTKGDVNAGGAFVELYAGAAGRPGAVAGLDQAGKKIEQWRVATQNANKATLEGANNFEKMATTAISVGVAVNAARAGVAALGAVTAAMNGDWEKMLQTIERLPLGLGAVVKELKEAGRSVKDLLQSTFGGNAVSGEGLGGRITAGLALAKIAAAGQVAAARTLERADVQILLDRAAAKKAELDRIDELAEVDASGAVEARAAVEAKYEAIEVAEQRVTAVAQAATEGRLRGEKARAAAKKQADENAKSAAEADTERERANANELRSLEADRDASLHVPAQVAAAAAAADIQGIGSRGVTAASAAGFQSLQSNTTAQQMIGELTAIRQSNQKILDSGAKFN